MPRFLHTYTGEFHWVADPSKVVYAILSHTWWPEELGGEQSYASILELQTQIGHTTNTYSPLYIDRSSATDADPGSIFFSDGLSDKIKNACKVAREAGYQLIWIDSGCIDKSSSAELAEAINSMFELYRLANVCFVYLADVPDGKDPRGKHSKFRCSRWHVRGWTLQELIAPKNVVFLTQTWTFLGTKTGLVSTLEQVTRVDVDILVGRAPVDSASVARRMSWAASRETTRVEDEAYSLLGIFGVHLSPIYGEGRNAFLRLQEEILKHIPDQSIFAWGYNHIEMEPCGTVFDSPPVEMRYLGRGPDQEPQSLLAPSPAPFLQAHDIIPLAPTAFALALRLPRRFPTSAIRIPPLRCILTPQGVVLTLLTIRCARGSVCRWIARDLRSLQSPGCEHKGATECLALLQCEASSSKSVIALALFRPTSEAEQNMGLRVTTRPCECATNRFHCRLVYISPVALNVIQHYLVPAELNLRRTLPWQEYSNNHRSPRVRMHLGPDGCPLFRLAPWCEERLRALGVAVSSLQVERNTTDSDSTTWIALRSSLTSDKPSVSGQARGAIGVIQITVHLAEVRKGPRTLDATISGYFCVKNKSRGTSQGAEPEVRWSPRFEFSNDSIPVTLRACSIHEAVFVLRNTEGGHQDQHGWRLLRLSLECPPDDLYSAWTSRAGFDISCLWISIELSDVLVDQPTVQDESHLRFSKVDFADTNPTSTHARSTLPFPSESDPEPEPEPDSSSPRRPGSIPNLGQQRGLRSRLNLIKHLRRGLLRRGEHG